MTNTENTVYDHDVTGRRVDIHAPSVINPGDYEYVRVGYARKHEVTGGPAGTCHHCGKAIVWQVYYTHVPSGKVVTFGFICAGILDLTDNRIDHEMVLLKREADNNRKKAMYAQAKEERRAVMTAEYPTVVEFLDNLNEIHETNHFIRSVKWSYEKYGSLWPNQSKAVLNVLKQRKEEIERKLNAPETELQPTEVLKEGRQLLTGTIVSHKYVQANDRYTPIKTHKMLVKLDNGNKVYGSVPVDVERHVDEGEYKGVRVKFTATVKVSEKDNDFGFFSRPTKAEVL